MVNSWCTVRETLSYYCSCCLDGLREIQKPSVKISWNPAQMWRVNLQSTCLEHCFPTSFARRPLLASKNNHEFSYPCSRKCSVRSIFVWYNSPQWATASSLSHSIRHTALGRNPLDEWSAQRWDLYLTTQNTYKRQTNSCPRRDWNPQLQPTSSCRPTPWTVRQMESASGCLVSKIKNCLGTDFG